MKSQYPNRFFGQNPVAVPNNGRKETEWSHDLPKDWRTAVSEGAAPSALPGQDEVREGDFDDA